MKMLKTLAWVAAIAALAAGSAQAQTPVKIGFLGTMSGPSAALGVDGLDGFKLAIALRDGKLGGMPVDIVVADDQLKPDVGAELAKRMVQRDKVDVLVGTTFSNVLMAVAGPVTRAGTFLVSPNAGPSPLAGAECHENFFAVAFQNDQIYEPMGAYLNKKGVKRVAALAPNYQAGKDAIAGFKRTFSGDIVQEIYTPIGQLDFAAELAQVRSANPEAVFVFYPGGLAVNFVKQYAQAGMKSTIPLYSGFALVDSTVRGAQGEAALGILTSGNWAPDLDIASNKTFVAAFSKAYGRAPSEYAMFAYDSALLLDSAIRAVKGNLRDKNAFRGALRAARFESARGTFRFNNNHFPVQDWLIREVVPAGAGTTLAARETVFKARADELGKACKMSW
jgi:branched-chain amino acid transport system substrate-binding protein